MPFKSQRQWRAAMGGHIPGISKEQAHEWAHETKKSFSKLPDRAPAEKGEPTLLSKKAVASSLERLEGFFAEAFKLAAVPSVAPQLGDSLRKALAVRKATPSAPSSLGDGLRAALQQRKTAGLGTVVSNSGSVGRFKGLMTQNALKAPGYAASAQAINPRRSITNAMNHAKPSAG